MENVEHNTEESQELIGDFVDEALASLADLPAHMDAHRQDPTSSGPINAVFRAIHSIKGCAGFLGVTAVKVFAHSLENTLDDVREQKVELQDDLQRALVQGFDLLDEMLVDVLEGNITDDLSPRQQDLLDQVEQLNAGCRSEPADPALALLDEIGEIAAEIAGTELPQSIDWAGRLARLAESFRGTATGLDEEDAAAPPSRPPVSFVGVACKSGGQDATDRVAQLTGFFMTVATEGYQDESGASFIESAQDFAAWAESANNETLATALMTAVSDLRKLIDSPLDMTADLLTIIWDHLWPEFVKLEEAAKPAVAADEAKLKKGADSSPPAPKSRLVRIKEERLDEFMEHVSSLFITRELLKDVHSRMRETEELTSLVEELQQINYTLGAQSTSLQQSVVALRRVAIAGLFAKFPKMARGLADQLEKKIDVHVSGEDVEIDKTLVEELDSPLTHMIRNVMDHGVETPEERQARGKSEAGNLWLHAEQTRTHVRIMVKDDGHGIDPEKLRKKIVEKEVFTAAQAAALTDQEAVELVFHAGFSTAEKLSEVSGRGVGMDVVRTSVQEQGGEVLVESQLGASTTFYLNIPIRSGVLVVDGLLLEHSSQRFVLPFEHILEITEITAAELTRVQGSFAARIRGETYGAVSLGNVLQLPDNGIPREGKLEAVLVGCKHGKLCLIVDHVFGHRQVVVNGLQDILPGNDKIAGVAQLGGGRLALVLSVPEIVKCLNELATV